MGPVISLRLGIQNCSKITENIPACTEFIESTRFAKPCLTKKSDMKIKRDLIYLTVRLLCKRVNRAFHM
ncbi:hypothetical protein OIU79_016241 [Salix purpurea]|uniref:Uncharacterized protein n=1 Tax=Salix purpurea TaxID=77065 RepID=A0A9Q0PDR4_SALPP|nr:hypothetical protein OIU79_016241 [Salix purpurea]